MLLRERAGGGGGDIILRGRVPDNALLALPDKCMMSAERQLNSEEVGGD